MMNKAKQNDTEAYYIQPAKNERSRKNIQKKSKENKTLLAEELRYYT